MGDIFRTPYEAKLEEEIKQLRAKLHHYEQCETRPTYSVVRAPEEISIDFLQPTVKLAIHAGYETTDNSAYHVFAKTRSGPMSGHVGYYISSPEIMGARDRAYVMQDGLRRATMQLAHWLGS